MLGEPDHRFGDGYGRFGGGHDLRRGLLAGSRSGAAAVEGRPARSDVSRAGVDRHGDLIEARLDLTDLAH